MYSKTQDMGLYGLSRRDCEGWMNSRYKVNRYKVDSINQLGYAAKRHSGCVCAGFCISVRLALAG